jgi:uncharacterized protein YjbI with pentapeptide repeats
MAANQNDNVLPPWDDPSYDARVDELTSEYERLKSAEMYELFKQGVLSQWQHEHPDESIYLQGLDLHNADFRAMKFPGASLNGSNLQGANFTWANLQGAFLMGTKLQGAILRGADLYHAHLINAKLQGANLTDANLKDADLQETNLQGANLTRANLEHANLQGANLQGANLTGAVLHGTSMVHVNLSGVSARFALVDGVTLLDDCRVDDETDFAAVGLGNARIPEGLKAQLKHNIRKQHWEGSTYRPKKWSLEYQCLIDAPDIPRQRPGRYREHPLLWLTWPFWWASDYGSSAARLFLAFFGVSMFFACLYMLPTFCAFTPPFVQGLQTYNEQALPVGLQVLRACYFSIVTMTTLGFGDITPHPYSVVGHVLVIVQVCLGYLLLGALITRLSVLFQEVE